MAGGGGSVGASNKAGAAAGLSADSGCGTGGTAGAINAAGSYRAGFGYGGMVLLETVAMAAPVEAAGMAVEELIQMALLMMIKVGVEDLTLPLLVRIVNMCQKDI